MESHCLQKDVGASSSDGQRRSADQLNFEFHRRIPIGVALQDSADISEVACRKRPTPDKGLVAGHQGIGIDIAQIDLVTYKMGKRFCPQNLVAHDRNVSRGACISSN